MFNFLRQSTTETSKITPTVIAVVPVNTSDEDARNQPVFTGTIAVASAVPSVWHGLNSVVVPESAVRDIENAGSMDRERVLLNLYQRSRFIRIVAVIDLAFIVVFGLFNSLFFLLVPFPISGYVGARKFWHRALYIYAMYLVLEVFGGIVSLILIHSLAFLIVRLVYVIANIIIFRYAINLAAYILVLEEPDMDFLKNSPVIINTEKSLLC